MPRNNPKPSLLLYCQHSVGLGHLTRSLALAGALADRFEVTVASGGAVPRRLAPRRRRGRSAATAGPRGGRRAVSPDRRRTVERAKALRGARSSRPCAAVARRSSWSSCSRSDGARSRARSSRCSTPRAVSRPAPLVVSSVRDILVCAAASRPPTTSGRRDWPTLLRRDPRPRRSSLRAVGGVVPAAHARLGARSTTPGSSPRLRDAAPAPRDHGRAGCSSPPAAAGSGERCFRRRSTPSRCCGARARIACG